MTGRAQRFLAILVAAALAACGRSEAPRDAAPIAKAAPRAVPERPAEGPPPLSAAERADAVHRAAFVADMHADTLMRVLDEGMDIGERGDKGHVDLPRLREGGVDAQVFAVWVEPDMAPDKLLKRVFDMIDAFHTMIERHPDRMALALTAADAERIAASGRVAAFLGIEGGYAIQDDLALLRAYHRLGARYMTLTWWHATDWADGSGDPPRWHGLNDLGREVVREMNRLGMVVDLSHVSDETFFDALEVTTRPVIASHSGCRAVCDHHRNLSDDMLRALAKNGGVVGINFYAGFLDHDFDVAQTALRERLKPALDALEKKYKTDPKRAREERWALLRREGKGIRPPGLGKLLDHIDHAVKVAGIDHVGLGSDFDGFGVGPEGLTDVSKLPLITAGLLERGYSEADVRKILGENVLRVFRSAIGE